jgi:hypothetical protein
MNFYIKVKESDHMATQNGKIEVDLNGEVFPNWQIFTYLAIINFLIAFLAKEFIFNREFYYTVFSDQMELTRIDKYVDIVERFSFWSLLFIPLFLFIRLATVAFILQIPLLLRYIEISFKYLFRWVMYASVFLTTGQVIHFLKIYFAVEKNLSKSIFQVQPVSLAAIVNPEEYTSDALVILNQFNLFDMLWVIVLYLGLLKTGKIKKMDAFLLVICVWIFMLSTQWALLFFLEKF